jgi:hypothetical protein
MSRLKIGLESWNRKDVFEFRCDGEASRNFKIPEGCREVSVCTGMVSH